MILLFCFSDELNWEKIFPNPFAEEPKGYYPISNACGQRGVSYQTSSMHTCSSEEEEQRYQCNVDGNMRIKAVSKSIEGRGNTPPELECFPRTPDMTTTGYYDPAPEKGRPRVINKPGDVVASRAGRTDVEG